VPKVVTAADGPGTMAITKRPATADIKFTKSFPYWTMGQGFLSCGGSCRFDLPQANEARLSQRGNRAQLRRIKPSLRRLRQKTV
jgi:hypothetical protein